MSVFAYKVFWLVIVTLAAFAGVATNRRAKGLKVWTHQAILYTLIAAAITLFVLKKLGVAP